LTLGSLSACSSSNEADTGGATQATGTGGSGAAGGTGSGSGGSGGTGGTGNLCTQPTAVPCSDQVIQYMNLQTDITPGGITNQPDGNGWTSMIDATAGGAFASDPDSYTYGRFTPGGLEKVDISDQDSLDSMDWDIAFRRYVVRINSGHSGPSCVTATRVAGTATYDDVTALPAGLTFRTDEYFTASCELIPDGSGLMDSPATALSAYWTYPGCVQMTDYVFVIELASGQHLKLAVVNYYAPAVQDQCDTMGMIPMTNTGAANFEVRWAFFP
jgi:hypothetical protein